MALTKSDTLNYVGELFQSGKKQTPFLNLIAGNAKRSASFVYPEGQYWALAAASQPAITEDASVGTLTPTTTSRTEVYNTAQIFQDTVAVSFKKQSTFGYRSGINTNDANPVTDELSFQKSVQLRQAALDMEYTFINGSYQAAANTATAAKTRGILEYISTNAVAAGGAALSRDLVDAALRKLADSGAPLVDPVIFVNGYQKQKLSRIYEYVPQDRNVGGSNIQLIETDFGQFGVAYDAQVPVDTVLIADMSMIAPVFVPVMFSEDTGFQSSMDGVEVLWQPTAVTNASYGGFLYSQAGLSSGLENFHAKISGLANA